MPVFQILYRCTLVACLLAASGWSQQTPPADWVLLRDLQILREPVQGAGVAGVQLASGRLIGWEQVLDLQAAAVPAADARRFLQQIGEPAARLEWRVASGDWAGAAELAASVRGAVGDTACSAAAVSEVAEAVARSRAGNWDAALQAYLRALAVVANRPEWQARWPASLQLPASLDTEAYRELPPLWLDPTEIGRAWTAWAGRVAAAQPESFSVMQVVYLASLAIAAGDAAAVAPLRADLQRRAPDWAQVLAAQQAVAAGELRTADERTAAWGASASWGELPRAVGRYWLALEQLRDPAADFDRAALRMLDVPASLGTRSPELSAAALAAVATAAYQRNDPLSGQKLVAELQTNYPETWTARHWVAPPPPPP